MVAVEILGVFDGALFLECPLCQHKEHRFPEGHWLREKAKPYVEGPPPPEPALA